MQIVSECIVINKTEIEFPHQTEQYLKTKIKSDIIRWAIVKADNDTYTIDYSYTKSK